MIVKDFSLCAACLVCKVTQNHKNLLYEIKYCGRPFKLNVYLRHWPRCLKITEKVSFNIASEASYVYILSGQKIIMANLASF